MTSANGNSPDELCRLLLATEPSPEREVLLDQASRQSDCLAYLLTESRNAVPSAPDRSLPMTDLAIELARRRQDDRSEASAWRIRAQALRVLGRHTEALPVFEAAAACALRASDSRLAAQVQTGRVDSLAWLGRYDEAIALANRLVAELRAWDAEADAARVLANLGSVHFRRDRYQEALDCYEAAARALSATGDPVAGARVQTNSANILTHLNRVDEALALYRSAREVFAARDMTSVSAMIDANVGFLHYLSGEHSTALAALTRARQEFAVRGQQLETAKCDADLADVYRALNLYPEALESYERAIAMFVEIPLDYERGKAELGRACVLLASGRNGEAEEALDEAERIFIRHKNRVQRAHARLLRALILRANGETSAAAMEAKSAARAFARAKLYGWAAEARFISADLQLSAGQDATKRMGAVARTARRYARGWQECLALRSIGLFYAQRGKIARALRFLRAAVETLEAARTQIASEDLHVAFLRDKIDVYDCLIETLLARGRQQDIDEAFACVERAKSRLLLERVQTALDGRLNGHEEGNAELRARLAALRSELSRSYHRLQAGDGEDNRRFTGASPTDLQRIVPLEQEYRALLREIELTQRSEVLTLSAVLPIRELSAALCPNEALIEYAIVHNEICAFVLTARGLTMRRALAEQEEIGELARRLRYHLQKAGLRNEYVACHERQLLAGVRRALSSLHERLLMPLLPLLPAGVERLVVVPHGSLHGLPFHALYDGECYMVDRWEFVYAPSAAVWYAGATRRRQSGIRTPGRALLMGVPEPGIERVLAEVEHLAEIMPGSELHHGQGVTLEMFRRVAGECSLIHLATHALFRTDNPLFSGLRFADGWLLARDLYEMRLDCDLATLSACRTGVIHVESGDELFGLTRGFLAAGARSLAVSLWPADDAATEALMIRFYGAMARGASRAAALRTAQRAVREQYPHPYHWAAFTLVGER